MENSFSLLSRVKSTGRAFGQHCRSAKANGNVLDGEFDAGIFRRKLHRVLPRRKCDFGLIGKAKCGHRFVVLQNPSSPRGEQFQLSQSRSMRIVTFTHCPIPISLAFAKPTATRQTSPREKGANKHPFCGSQKGDSRKTRGFSRAPAAGDIGLFCPNCPLANIQRMLPWSGFVLQVGRAGGSIVKSLILDQVNRRMLDKRFL